MDTRAFAGIGAHLGEQDIAFRLLDSVEREWRGVIDVDRVVEGRLAVRSGHNGTRAGDNRQLDSHRLGPEHLAGGQVGI